MATKKVTTKTATNGKVQHTGIAPDDLRNLLLEVETALATWRNAHMPADVRTLSHFAGIADELLTLDGCNDAPATHDILERSVIEALPEARATLKRVQDREARNVIQPGMMRFPLYFIRTMRDAAREALGDWLKANAPAEIVELFRAMDALDCATHDTHALVAPDDWAQVFHAIAIGKKIVGNGEWPNYFTTQPDESADGMQAVQR